jgi:hypothetical protein
MLVVTMIAMPDIIGAVWHYGRVPLISEGYFRKPRAWKEFFHVRM